MEGFCDSLWDGDVSQILGSMAPNGFWQRNSYYAHCPLHQDRDWSFSFEKGTRQWRCYSGCGEGDLVSLGVRLWNCGIDNALARMGDLLNGAPRKRIQTYSYVDETGQLLYEIIRYEPKAFSVRRPASWTWTLDDVPRVLYRLPDVLAAKELFILEGEKDCETARSWGLIATCNAEGGGRWKEDFIELFRNKTVRIVSDADETGRWHARQVAGSLVPVAAAVKMIELPGAKDLTEWAEHGGTSEELFTLFRNAPILTAADVVGWWNPHGTVQLTSRGGLLLEPMWLTFSIETPSPK